MVKLQDISLYFKSDCCNKQQTNNRQSAPCRNSAPSTSALLYFKHLELTLGYDTESLHVATVTIGNKYYGQLSAQGQYKHFIKTIKDCYPYRGATKYLFYFELNSVGLLHAHGIIYNGYRGRFIDYFNKFGTRNIHKDSYQPLRNKGYLAHYIHKDVEKMIDYPPINNITKKDINSLVVSGDSEGRDEVTFQKSHD